MGGNNLFNYLTYLPFCLFLQKYSKYYIGGIKKMEIDWLRIIQIISSAIGLYCGWTIVNHYWPKKNYQK
jgi:hypothetical protein